MVDWSTIIILVARGAYWLYRRWRPMSSKTRLQRETRWRAECVANLQRISPGCYGKVIIRDIKRWDRYPRLEKQGVTNWYRTEVIGFYPHGIETLVQGLAGRWAVWRDNQGRGRWKFLDSNEEIPGKVRALPVSRIPFAWIEAIEWDGDHAYGEPHIYCQFRGPWGGPSEAIIYKAALPDSDYLYELEGLVEPKPSPWGLVKAWYREQEAPTIHP